MEQHITNRIRLTMVSTTEGFSRSTLTAAVLRSYMISRMETTERAHPPVWFYPVTPCMGQHIRAEVRMRVQCLPSTLMEQVLRPCTASVAVKELYRWPVWLYPSPPCME